MTYKVKISETAEKDIREIYEYIAFELLSPSVAAAQVGHIEKSILSLDEMPMRFRIYENEPWKSRGLRVMPVDNYLVFYIPYEENHTVNILRIMYGGRDIEKQLNK